MRKLEITQAHKDMQQHLSVSSSDGFTRFTEANRKTGSATALVNVVIETNGYMIIKDFNVKRAIVNRHPNLDRDRVLTMQQVRRGRHNHDPRPVFIDTTAVCGTK